MEIYVPASYHTLNVSLVGVFPWCCLSSQIKGVIVGIGIISVINTTAAAAASVIDSFVHQAV